MAKDPQKMNRTELVVEVRKLQHLLKTHMEGPSDTLWFESGVNERGKPFVRIHWGNEAGQLTVDKAKQHGLHMLEVAAAAEFDAAFFSLATNDMDLTPDRAAAFLGMMREHRGGDRDASASGS